MASDHTCYSFFSTATYPAKKNKALGYFGDNKKVHSKHTYSPVAPCPSFEENEGLTVSSLQFAKHIIEPIQVKNTLPSFGMLRAQRETI